jgi:hypothetical protein
MLNLQAKFNCPDSVEAAVSEWLIFKRQYWLISAPVGGSVSLVQFTAKFIVLKH